MPSLIALTNASTCLLPSANLSLDAAKSGCLRWAARHAGHSRDLTPKVTPCRFGASNMSRLANGRSFSAWKARWKQSCFR